MCIAQLLPHCVCELPAWQTLLQSALAEQLRYERGIRLQAGHAPYRCTATKELDTLPEPTRLRYRIRQTWILACSPPSAKPASAKLCCCHNDLKQALQCCFTSTAARQSAV